VQSVAMKFFGLIYTFIFLTTYFRPFEGTPHNSGQSTDTKSEEAEILFLPNGGTLVDGRLTVTIKNTDALDALFLVYIGACQVNDHFKGLVNNSKGKFADAIKAALKGEKGTVLEIRNQILYQSTITPSANNVIVGDLEVLGFSAIEPTLTNLIDPLQNNAYSITEKRKNFLQTHPEWAKGNSDFRSYLAQYTCPKCGVTTNVNEAFVPLGNRDINISNVLEFITQTNQHPNLKTCPSCDTYYNTSVNTFGNIIAVQTNLHNNNNNRLYKISNIQKSIVVGTETYHLFAVIQPEKTHHAVHIKRKNEWETYYDHKVTECDVDKDINIRMIFYLKEFKH